MKGLRLFITGIVIITFQLSKADVKIADVFSDNMVLQRNINVRVWGHANPGERITVSFNGQKCKTKADKVGKWLITLQPMKAGGPYDMTISGKNEFVLKNILIGDIWICSGQSNMQWPVSKSNNPEKEIKNAIYPEIRLLTVPKQLSNVLEEDMPNTSWHACSPETVKDFSAVGYFFGRDLQREIGVPIGLINSTWGGTCVETWTSKESITKLPKYEDFGQKIDSFDAMEIEKINKNALSKALGIDSLPEKETGMVEQWMKPTYDRSNWQTMNLPTHWEDVGYLQLDGIVWFSYNFELNAINRNDKVLLNLGKIDNSDLTWVNGQKVGGVEWESDIERVYKIPESILQVGKNNITIRVDNKWGKGGFASQPENFFLQLGPARIPLSGDWKFKADRVYDKFKASPNEAPSLLYNAMINPLIPYGIKGVIWYQGENNTPRAKEYATTFPNMIENWRKNWHQGDFAFLFVQLANFTESTTSPGNSNWAELRESQVKTLSLKNTGMAVSIDIGEALDIHPRNKQDVGKRLMLSALKIAYDKEVVFSGPIYKSMQIEGDKVIVSFDNIGSGLMTKSKHGYINEFEVAGEDKVFHWAKAEIENNKVVVWSDKVIAPIAVRFGWSNNPAELNLYNKEGLPSSPFRTDDWMGVTEGKSFDD
ncbi:sialate O-acetylesterase [Carboxylicivirga sp. M1479]|uniref:sialate O-acetylesterase n=1 Tax=Carboxylicivirga sp. M1479 TaxID=2594476 RepID=UPI00117885F4|nr:sialate O-acetylesterase [Carboxylicivirga sp. M1479]TRX70386.1 9-O-acetylesterase [Carboxylicivirga sp. M1479]